MTDPLMDLSKLRLFAHLDRKPADHRLTIRLDTDGLTSPQIATINPHTARRLVPVSLHELAGLLAAAPRLLLELREVAHRYDFNIAATEADRERVREALELVKLAPTEDLYNGTEPAYGRDRQRGRETDAS